MDAKAEVGEGPCWNEREQRLYWVDITAKVIHVYDPSRGEDRKIQMDHYVGAVVARKSGGVVLAMGHGFYHMDEATRKIAKLAAIDTNAPEIRFNDGKVDPAGRFWAGTMDMDGKVGAGSLYCLDTDCTVRRMLTGVTISNGLAWSADHRNMYYIDTHTRQVCRFDYDKDSGMIANRQVVVQVPEQDGFPDGMTIDAEGMLWVAQWGGSRVVRYRPDTGEELERIQLPVTQASSCAFGGKELDELWITTARYRLTAEELQQQPAAGALFSVKSHVKGLPAVEFAG